jgi:hypothetical protein
MGGAARGMARGTAWAAAGSVAPNATGPLATGGGVARMVGGVARAAAKREEARRSEGGGVAATRGELREWGDSSGLCVRYLCQATHKPLRCVEDRCAVGIAGKEDGGRVGCGRQRRRGRRVVLAQRPHGVLDKHAAVRQRHRVAAVERSLRRVLRVAALVHVR